MSIIKDISMYQVRIGLEKWLWIAIETVDGHIGWGEASDSGNDDLVANLITQMASPMLGSDVHTVHKLIKKVGRSAFPIPSTNRFSSTAVSVVDQAIWDLKAQIMGIPLFVAIGSDMDGPIPLYANLNRALREERSPEAYGESAVSACRAGFDIVKCTPFDEVMPWNIQPNLAPGLERLRSVLEVVPLSNVAIDCHARFHPAILAQLLHEFPVNSRPYWIEDPTPGSYRQWDVPVVERYPEIRWAGGESANSLNEALGYMERPWLNIIMPDVKHMGGVSGVRTLMEVAEAKDFWVSCHNPSGPIATAVSAHLATIPIHAVPLEYPWGQQNIRRGSTIPEEPVRDGAYHLSLESGIGLAPNPDFLKEYGSRWRSGSWESIS